VTPEEAEEATSDPERLIRDLGVVNGEPRCQIIGRTRGGRILVVYTTERGTVTRIATAYPATGHRRREYIER
jgi:uncharacterized DUF497 family protein